MVKIEWNECLACKCTLHNRDKSAHSEICSEESPLDINSINLSTLKHCLIIGNIFVGISAINDDSIENMPASYVDRLVHMHPTTMQFIGLRIGQSVCLDNMRQAILWPNARLAVQSLGMSKRSMKRNNLVEKIGISLVKCKENNPIPREIMVSLNGDACNLIDDDEFLELHKFVSRKLVGAFVNIGSVKIFNYFGRECMAQITQLDDKVQEISDSDDLNTQLMSLNISVTEPSSSVRSKNLPFRKLHLPTHSDFCNEFNLIETKTKIKFDQKNNDISIKNSQSSSLQPIGGLDVELNSTFDLVTKSLSERDSSRHLLCSGVIVHGAHGCGKSLLLNETSRKLKKDTNISVLQLNASDVWSKFYGESESKLISYFKEARLSSPCVLCIDDVDTICCRRDKVGGTDVERRITSCFLNQLDLLKSSDSRIFVLTTTSKMDDLDPSVLRSGRLDNEIEINVPSSSQRLQILQAILGSTDHNLLSSTLDEVAANTHGFVGSDLHSLCKEATVHAHKFDRELIVCDDLRFAMGVIKPSAMREIAIEIPKVYWSDIGGQEKLKHQLKQAIEWPLKHPESFKRLGIRPPKGLLMYGPPGCSKTLVAKALACESKLNFISIKGPELFSKWVGESEKAVREVFRKARRACPSIVFFDEIDALAGERTSGDSGDVSNRVLAQLLTEMDGVDCLNEVTVIAATNRPDRIDKALLRPGRLDRVVYVPLPDQATRRQIFTIRFTKRTPVQGDVSELADRLSKLTQGYSGAEVVAVCEEASLLALEQDMNCCSVSEQCFLDALKLVKPRTSPESVAFYENYHNNTKL